MSSVCQELTHVVQNNPICPELPHFAALLWTPGLNLDKKTANSGQF